MNKTQKQNPKANNPSQQQLNNLLEHYQNSRFADAEKLALVITGQFPGHQFAWKILGAIFGLTGRKSEAVDANQKAVDLSPQDTQSLINLGVALLELGRLDEAEASFTQVITLKPDYTDAHYNLGNTLRELGRLEEAAASYNQAVASKPDHAKAHYNLGITLKQLGRLEEAAASYNQAIASKPDYAQPYFNLGNTLKELGRLDEAVASYSEAIALRPDFTEAHSNLGSTFKELGRLDEAIASYSQAIAVEPGYAEAHSNLGGMLQELGRLNEALARCKQAIALKPGYAEAHYNLANTLKELGRLDEAVASYSHAVALKPDFADAYFNLSQALKNTRFNSSNRELYPILLQLLTGNYTRPRDVANSILSLLKHDPLIKDLLLEKNVVTSLTAATSIIGRLNKLPLLHHLMRVSTLHDLQVEGFFVTMRRFLLANLNEIEVSPDVIYFLSTLCLHCFTNEYVYFESNEEASRVNKLEKDITQSIAQSERPEVIKILCLASYRPIHKYDWCQQLEALDHLEEVMLRLIEEPQAEKVIAADIPTLGEISNDVSQKVKAQYEENPYPRWVKLGIHKKAKSIAAVCDDAKLHLHSESIKDVLAPAILVAGCGTGQHSIGTATRFSGCQVTAVDLSLASLAYAKRKTAELGITNLGYLQADILKLNNLNQEFDIIESAGVLHHMDEPMAGWGVLTDLLKPSGLMRIGLYSELARNHILEVRKEIALRKLGISEADIREFRCSLAESRDENHQLLTKSADFFSLSELRDLIFHVQEHRFTLPRIKNCLNELELKFCGFEDQGIVSRFKKFHGEGSDTCDLVLWHKFEESNPDIFIGMYQFWCQKL